MLEVGIGVAVFTGIITALVVVILAARSLLLPRGTVAVTVNATTSIEAPAGARLLTALAERAIYLPSACGGRGTCGQCTITVRSGGGSPLGVESSLLGRRQLAAGRRLACQLTLREDIAIEVPSEILGVTKWRCTVDSARLVTTLLKEIVLAMPDGQRIDFQAGSYVQVTCPPHVTRFDSFQVDAIYRQDWDRLGLWRYVAASETAATRAYSIASAPSSADAITLLVRIAVPPPAAAESVPPGVVSSYLFGLEPGDSLEVCGPYGSFGAREGDREMVLVGGGAGMAPLRSIIVDQLERVGTSRKISFWYGARNLKELCYAEQFDALAARFENFEWRAALSEPAPDEAWDGDVGFIHEVLYARYLEAHPTPESCEYYLCGPPMMARAVLRMLDGLGVDRDDILFDDFGG